MVAPRPIAPGLFTMNLEAPRLVAARCRACARIQFPSSETCPYCGHTACDTIEVGPSASLFLFTAIRTAPPGYRGALPYGFGVVELPEGLRVITRLTEADPGSLHPGIAMQLVIVPLSTDDDGTPVVSYAFARAATP